MVFQIAALIPMGMGIAKASRNASDASDGPQSPLCAKKARSQGIVERMIAGGNGSPISHWSDQHLERVIKTNSAFRAHAEELRTAHKASRA